MGQKGKQSFCIGVLPTTEATSHKQLSKLELMKLNKMKKK